MRRRPKRRGGLPRVQRSRRGCHRRLLREKRWSIERKRLSRLLAIQGRFCFQLFDASCLREGELRGGFQLRLGALFRQALQAQSFALGGCCRGGAQGLGDQGLCFGFHSASGGFTLQQRGTALQQWQSRGRRQR